jgi:hypothetical protein
VGQQLYQRDVNYTGTEPVVDYVSRNGNFPLNFTLLGSGEGETRSTSNVKAVETPSNPVTDEPSITYRHEVFTLLESSTYAGIASQQPETPRTVAECIGSPDRLVALELDPWTTDSAGPFLIFGSVYDNGQPVSAVGTMADPSPLASTPEPSLLIPAAILMGMGCAGMVRRRKREPLL